MNHSKSLLPPRLLRQLTKTQSIVFTPRTPISRSVQPRWNYSKPIRPSKPEQRPHSTVYLDRYSSDSQSDNSQISRNVFQKDNNSCCCSECGQLSKKIKKLMHRYKQFKPKMHLVIIKRKKLISRFRVAVYVIMMILKKRKAIRLNARKKLTRLKTTQFEPISSQFNNGQPQIAQTLPQKSYSIEPQVRAAQLRIIDSKHKPKQSVQLYMEQKLHDAEQSNLPKVQVKHSKQSFVNLSPHKVSTASDGTPLTTLKAISLYSPQKQALSSPYLQPGSMPQLIDNFESYQKGKPNTSRPQNLGYINSIPEIHSPTSRAQIFNRTKTAKKKTWSERNFIIKT